MKYNKYLDHHCEDYNPERIYTGMDKNDYEVEKALGNYEN